MSVFIDEIEYNDPSSRSDKMYIYSTISVFDRQPLPPPPKPFPVLVENSILYESLRGLGTRTIMIQNPTNRFMYKKAINKFTNDEYTLLEEYRNLGMEINTRWRMGSQSVDDEKKATKLANSFKELSYLFDIDNKRGGDYITVCRHMDHEFAKENLRGFISTSNKCLNKFGNAFVYYIKIPKDAHVGLVRLYILDSYNNYIPDLFEVILPQKTVFYITSDGYLVVKTKYSEENHEKFNIKNIQDSTFSLESD
jgi:hypothetical protein